MRKEVIGMNYDMNDIMPYFYSFHLDEYCEFSSNDVSDYIGTLPATLDFNWDTGISKCVIIPKNLPYVIKIPFSYIVDEPIDFSEGSLLDKFKANYGIDYHCPMENDWDFIEYEQILYHLAKRHGVEKFFLENIRIHVPGLDYPVYIQPKAITIDSYDFPNNSYDNYIDEETLCNIYVHYNCIEFDLPSSWNIQLYYDFEDEDEADAFFSFLKCTGIDHDLHRNNIGFYNHHAVIIDYAGFLSEE